MQSVVFHSQLLHVGQVLYLNTHQKELITLPSPLSWNYLSLMDASFDNRSTWHCFYPAQTKGVARFFEWSIGWVALVPLLKTIALCKETIPHFFRWESCSFHRDPTPSTDNMQSLNILSYTCCPHPFSCVLAILFCFSVYVTFAKNLPITNWRNSVWKLLKYDILL